MLQNNWKRHFSPPVHCYIFVIVFVIYFIVIHQGVPTLHNRTSDFKSPAKHPYTAIIELGLYFDLKMP